MSDIPPQPALAVVIPLIGAAVLGGIRIWVSRRVADTLALLFCLATLIDTSLLLNRTLRAPIVYWFGNWYPRGSMVLGIGFVAEPIGTSLAVLACLLTFLSLLFAWNHVDSGERHFQPLMLIFMAAMCGFVLTSDLFNLFVWFELMSTAAFALCGLKTAEPAPLQGSFNFAVTNTIAAFMVLTGIGMLYSATGSLSMGQIGLQIGGRHDPLILFAFTLLICGFMVKAAMVPFHLWLPDAHAVAPTPVCVLFSGLMVELGLYAIVRIHTVIFSEALQAHVHAVQMIFLTVGMLTAVLGGVMSYSEHHLKRLLAFSTISHAGLMMVAFAMQNVAGLSAMFVYLLAHAMVKSGLFFVCGVLLNRLRAISERELFGKGRHLRLAGLFWMLGGAGLAGAPPFCTMLGEAAASQSQVMAGFRVVPLIFLLSGVLTGGAVFRVGLHTFLGWGGLPTTDSAAEVGELPETKADRSRWFHIAPPGLCIFASMAITFLPGWQPVLRAAAGAMGNQKTYLHTLYTGTAVRIAAMEAPELKTALWHGLLSVFLAFLLACSSVFRIRLMRWMRAGAYLEGGFRPLRAMQSGHPGDYVFWLLVGVSIFGTAALAFLRS
jgi:multicomponent Na+:H+ antiporter subunit D